MRPDELERAFDDEMERICERANDEIGYKPARFLNMVRAIGGREAVRKLLPSMSDGFTALWERDRLDLTFEYVMLHPRWNPLFTRPRADRGGSTPDGLRVFRTTELGVGDAGAPSSGPPAPAGGPLGGNTLAVPLRSLHLDGGPGQIAVVPPRVGVARPHRLADDVHPLLVEMDRRQIVRPDDQVVRSGHGSRISVQRQQLIIALGYVRMSTKPFFKIDCLPPVYPRHRVPQLIQVIHQSRTDARVCNQQEPVRIVVLKRIPYIPYMCLAYCP